MVRSRPWAPFSSNAFGWQGRLSATPIACDRHGRVMNARQFCLGMALAIALPVMGQSGALAQGTAEQQEACRPDVFRLSGSFIPDVDRIVACLKANEPNLNPACHDV